MSEAHDWEWLRDASAAPSMRMQDYLELPEELARTIEVTGGMIVLCESPSENHLGIQQNLASALQNAVEKFDLEAGECHRVRMDIDVLLEDDPSFTFRRPDLTVYRCLRRDGTGRWTKPRAQDALLVIEVVSEHTVGIDLLEKRTRYAKAGIPCYWIVRMAHDDGRAISIEQLRLSAEGVYVSEGMQLRGRSSPAVEAIDPIPVTISWEELDRGL